MRVIRSKTKQAERLKDQADLVCADILKYAKLIGLDDEWRFAVTFKHLSDCLATTEAEVEYRKATMEFDLAAIAKQGNDLIAPTVRHELFHIPCWRLHEITEALNPEAEALMVKYGEELVTFLEHMPVWKELK